MPQYNKFFENSQTKIDFFSNKKSDNFLSKIENLLSFQII